jgi:hypothetical protein
VIARRGRAIRLSIDSATSTPTALATASTSSINVRTSSLVIGEVTISASVARVRALNGLSVALPRSFSQISLRIRVWIGALRPALTSIAEIAWTRSLREPSGSPRVNRLPSRCSMIPGSITCAAG